jgi:hypothetical protein
LVTAVPILALMLLTELIDVRAMFVNVSPALRDIIILGQDSVLVGGILLALLMAVGGLAGAGVPYVPEKIRRPVVTGLLWTLGIGLMGELFVQMIRSWFSGNPATGRAVINAIFSNGALAAVNGRYPVFPRGRHRYCLAGTRRCG